MHCLPVCAEFIIYLPPYMFPFYMLIEFIGYTISAYMKESQTVGKGYDISIEAEKNGF